MALTVFDVANYIVNKIGPISAMKLQKLIYYAQAWSLVWDDAPMFDNKIEAWANGPVCRDLYDKHRGIYQVSVDKISPHSHQQLSPPQAETVDEVLRAYGDKSAQWLSDQTHSEEPWIKARAGLKDGERGSNDISHESMADYYLRLKP